MTIYKPAGYKPGVSTDYFYTSLHGGNHIDMFFKQSGGGLDSWSINKDYALKAVCQAYIGSLTETSDVRVAMIAHLAGYTLKDGAGDKLRAHENYKHVRFSFDYGSPSSFKITQPNPMSKKLAKLKATYAELGKEIEAIEGGSDD
jgi:hypothetical protein